MMLGRYLARALAGEQNTDEARSWLEKALAQGLTDAQGDLAALPAAKNAPPAVPVPEAPAPRAAAGRRGAS